MMHFYPMKSKKPVKRKAEKLDDNQEVYEKIGNRIKALRLEAGYSNAEKFAFENEITRSQYANWEKGQDMKLSSLLRIAQAHGLTLQEFFADIKEL
jgi:transcriptional regulator with XRE-family HTH domain